MKKIIFILLVLHPFLTNAQTKREFERTRAELAQDTFDILPQPGEYPTEISVPLQKRDGTRALVTNWGSDLQKVNQLRQRIKAECTGKVHVRILDTAPGTDHQQLGAGLRPGKSFTGEAYQIDKNGHGTHVAGIMFASDFGLLYDLCQNGTVTWEFDQVLNASGSGSFGWITNCENDRYQYDAARAEQGIRTVITASLGGNTAPISGVEDAFKKHTDIGCVYTFAAGNTGGSPVNYPGSSAYGIACGALGPNLTVASYSSRGPEVWAAEPGSGIQSTWLNNQFATLSGTSMATPFLAAVTSIALSKWGSDLKDYNAVKQYLAAVSQDIAPVGKDNNSGYGLALIEKILDTRPGVVSPPNPPNPPTPTDPVREERNIVFTFDGPLVMYWDTEAGNSQTGKPRRPSIRKVAKSELKNSALKTLTINRIEYRVKFSTDATLLYDRIKDAHGTLIFKNRAVIIPSGQDYADATYWTAYFSELLLWSQYTKKIDAVVTRIEATTQEGRKVAFSESGLKHFPK